MTFAKILEDVGDFGPYQKKLLVFFFIPCFTVLPWFSMHVIFLTGIPGHWCYVPEIAKSNLSLEMQKALIMPPSDPRCSMYDVNYTEILLSHNPNFNNETPTKPCDKGWFYENSEFDQTAVTEWDLVCKDDHYVNLLLSTTFIGIFLGSQFFSSLSSKIGRKPTFLISALIIAVSDVGSSVNHYFLMVVLLRILQGTAISSIYSTPYALILEIVRPELRTLMNEIATVSWTAGLCLLPMIAWVSRSWVIMSGLNSSCALVLFLCGSVIPESPMWLVTQGQYRKANDILKKMSKLNGKTAHQDDGLLERVQVAKHNTLRRPSDEHEVPRREQIREFLPGLSSGNTSSFRDVVLHRKHRKKVDPPDCIHNRCHFLLLNLSSGLQSDIRINDIRSKRMYELCLHYVAYSRT
ncbi:organic cation transporter 1 [Trichonephila inaurata madagascariensis]|uniref:Organic cation transporter 1 n=1 Tax=Trichonephila inaurata madagascariensis TaxID=2747483 RepID=A0A8X7CSE0_9ARAC|nr:organic cation transporter 1 [Trichonephila inaurata madagascariensis]